MAGTMVVISLKAGYEEAVGGILCGDLFSASYDRLVKQQELLGEGDPKLCAFAELAESPDEADREAAFRLVELELSSLQQEIVREAREHGATPFDPQRFTHAADLGVEECHEDGLHWRWQGAAEDPSHDPAKVPESVVREILGRLEKLH